MYSSCLHDFIHSHHCSSVCLVKMLLTLGLALVSWTTLIHTQNLEIFDLTKNNVLTCSQGLADCKVKPGGTCPNHKSVDRINVSNPSAHPLLCSSSQGVRPCLRIWINVTTSVVAEEMSGDDDYNKRNENTTSERGSGQEPFVSQSMCLQVCYQSPDFFDSDELTFTLSSSNEHPTQEWLLLIVELREVDFGSTVTVYSSNFFTKNIELPALDKVCYQGLAIAICKVPKLYSEINPKTRMAKIYLDELTKDEVRDLKACQSMEKDGGCLKLEWKENPLVIPMTSVAPCLCFQVWLEYGPRKMFCPFSNKTALSVSNVSVSLVESLNHNEAMARNSTSLVWNITAPCRLDIEIYVCKKTSASNKDCKKIDDLRNSSNYIPNRHYPKWNSINSSWQLQGEFVEVERHPSLCVQINIKSIKGDFDLLCPFEITRTHWSLYLLVSVLFMCLVILAAYVLQGLIKGWMFKWLKMDSISSRVGDGQVVLLYPPDADNAVAELVCHLGSALSSLGFGVSLELWSRKELNALGPVPWLHSRLHRMQSHGGKVVLVLTPAAWIRAEEWCRSRGEKNERRENCSDVFSASLSCILADYLQGRAGERFALVQFETQPTMPPNERGSMPELFRGLPLFSLPSQSLGFLTEITHGAHKGQQENGRAKSRRTRASVLRAGARILAGRLRELSGSTGYKLAGVSQDGTGVETDDPWVTIPLTLEHLTPPDSPEVQSESSTVN